MNKVPIENIHTGEVNIISFPEFSEKLNISVAKCGIIQPIILSRIAGNNYELVSGLRRFNVCKMLGSKDIPAIILEKALTPIEIFNTNLEDNLSSRRLNLIEISNVLNILKNTLNLDEHAIRVKYMPMLNLPGDIKYMEYYLFVARLSSDIKMELLNKNISVDIVSHIKDWPTSSIESLLPLLLEFNFGTNKLFQLLTLINEISVRDNKPLENPLSSAEWLSVYNKEMPLFQKGLWLREYLLSLRYPRYTALTSKLKHAIHNLKLPKYISLSTDELLTLEKKHLNFSVLCKKTDDLSSSGQYLAELAKSEEIKRIVTILNEE